MAKMRKVGRSAASVVTQPASVDYSNRAALIETSHRAALSDSRFMDDVRSGDSQRDQRQWVGAERAYAAAMARYPYQAGYWVQHGHMAKEQQRWGRAEISYRSACALGAKPADVYDHLRFVMVRQEVNPDDYPPQFLRPGPAAAMPPAEVDATAFARLLWRVRSMDENDMLTLLRSSATCDTLLERMISDPRFERANRDWLELVREGEL